MYKNQLQELAQRSCFNLPSYTCVREGPDHAPRFKAAVNFNGETYECPNYCTTLRQAEHSAAEVALNALASRGPTNSLAARILDETGVYKNLLQEVSQRVGASLPTYTTSRSGLGHLPVFTCIVELAGVTFTGEPAKNKKQAEKNAAMAAWSALKLLAQQSENSSQKLNNDEQEHVTVARALQKYRIRARMSNTPFPIRFPMPKPRPASTQPPPATGSKILPLICPKKASRCRYVGTSVNGTPICPKTSSQSGLINPSGNDALGCSKTSLENRPVFTSANELAPSAEGPRFLSQKFPAAGAAPYIPVRQFRPHHGIAPPVTIRNAIPAYSAPPLPPPSQSIQVRRPPSMGIAPPVCIRQSVPAFSAPVRVEEDTQAFKAPINPPSARVESLPPATKIHITPPIRVEALPNFKSPITPAPVRVENLPTLKAFIATGPSTQVNNPPVSEGSTIPSAVRMENLHTFRAPIGQPPSSSMPKEETGKANETNLQEESLVSEDLKELKI